MHFFSFDRDFRSAFRNTRLSFLLSFSLSSYNVEVTVDVTVDTSGILLEAAAGSVGTGADWLVIRDIASNCWSLSDNSVTLSLTTCISESNEALKKARIECIIASRIDDIKWDSRLTNAESIAAYRDTF